MERAKKWYGKYRDHNRDVQRVPLCTDKSAAQAMLNELVAKAERRRAGRADPFEEQNKRPLTEHLVAYRRYLEAKGNSPDYVDQTVHCIELIAGLKLGVCTRPGDMAVRRNWKSDQVIRINPDDPGHRAMLWQRFKNMIDKGCTLFYLDSFGWQFEHVKLMQFLREKMGPEVLTFAEHQCDAILPYSGGYSEATFSAGKQRQPAGYHVWAGDRHWEIYRWLVPVSDFRRLPRLGKLQPLFLDSLGQWKHRSQ